MIGDYIPSFIFLFPDARCALDHEADEVVPDILALLTLSHKVSASTDRVSAV